MNISFEHSKNREYLLKKVKWVMCLTALLMVMLIIFPIINTIVLKNKNYGVQILKETTRSQLSVVEQTLSKCEELLSSSINDDLKASFSDYKAMEKRVSDYSWSVDFLRDYGLFDANGNGVFKNLGKQNIFSKDVFSDATLNDGVFVINDIFNGINASPILALPVKDNGETIGYVVGVLSESALNITWETNVGGEDTVTFVTDKDLSILFRYDHKSFFGKNNDFNSFLSRAYYFNHKTKDSVKKSIIDGKCEMMKVRYRSVKKILYSIPSEKYDLYMIKLFPFEKLNAGLKTSKILFLIETIACVLALAGIAYFVLMILLHYKRAAESLVLFDKLNDEYETTTIEYNFITRRLFLGGCAERTFGIEKKRFEWARVTELYDCIHPEDKGVRETIENAVKNKEKNVTAEVRIRKADDEYDWHRLIAVIVKDSNDEPIRFFGYVKKTEAEMDEARAFKRQSEEDLLTGILNKVAVENEVNKAFTEKPDGMYVFFITDLDNFKSVNDNLGHAKGDEAIRDTAQKLVKVFSINDFVGRIGGDEFAVVMTVPENMTNKVDALIDMKVKAISKNLARTYKKGDIKVSVTASIGIVIRTSKNQTFTDLYQMADKALYASKNGGKNKATYYTEL